MSITSDYLQIRAKLDTAITAGLQGKVADGLKEKVQTTARNQVYNYVTDPATMTKRRMENGGLIDPSTMLTSVDGTTLTLQNTSEPQNAEGILLTPIVEEGWSSWHQPYAREFMDDARDEYVDNGDAKDDLMDAIRSAGFTVG